MKQLYRLPCLPIARHVETSMVSATSADAQALRLDVDRSKVYVVVFAQPALSRAIASSGCSGPQKVYL